MKLTNTQINLLATLQVLLQGNEPALFQLDLLKETIEKDATRLEELAWEAASTNLLCDELITESTQLTTKLEVADALVIDYRARMVDQSETITDLKTKLDKQREQHKVAMAQVRGVKKDLGVKDPTRSEPKTRPAKKRGRPVGSTNKPEGESK